MYLRILRCWVDPKDNSRVEDIEDRVSTLYVPEHGCEWTRFIVDREEGMWGNVSLWNSREDIEALGELDRMQQIKEELAPLLLEPPEINVYELYEPEPPDDW